MAFEHDTNVDMILIYIHFSYIIFVGYKKGKGIIVSRLCIGRC